MKQDYRQFETNELVVMYQEEPSEELFNEILSRSKGIIYKLAKSYLKTIPGAELEDLVSEAYIKLWDAVQDFVPGKYGQFTSFLYGCISRQYNKLYDKAIAPKRTAYCTVSLESAIYSVDDDDSAKTYLDEIEDICEEYDTVEMKMVLSCIKLSKRENQVVKLLLQGFSKPDIAHYLGIKLPEVHTYAKRAGNKLLKACA